MPIGMLNSRDYERGRLLKSQNLLAQNAKNRARAGLLQLPLYTIF